MDDNVRKEDLFDVIRHGHIWHAEKIKKELEKLVVMNSRNFNHELRYDTDDKFHFIYDNECYLFVFDGKIEVRCDRDNVFSANETFNFETKEAKEILSAYEKFNSTTMEDEED